MRMNTPKRSFLHGIGIKYFITAFIRSSTPVSCRHMHPLPQWFRAVLSRAWGIGCRIRKTKMISSSV